jgi:hypothetical protein
VRVVTGSPVPSLFGRAQTHEFLTPRRTLRFILAGIAVIVIAAIEIAAILGISTDAAHPRGQRTHRLFVCLGDSGAIGACAVTTLASSLKRNPVREKPGPPSNRMGDFRFTTKRAERQP